MERNLARELEQLRDEFNAFKRNIELGEHYGKSPYSASQPCLFDSFNPRDNITLGLACPCPKCTPR